MPLGRKRRESFKFIPPMVFFSTFALGGRDSISIFCNSNRFQKSTVGENKVIGRRGSFFFLEKRSFFIWTSYLILQASNSVLSTCSPQQCYLNKCLSTCSPLPKLAPGCCLLEKTCTASQEGANGWWLSYTNLLSGVKFNRDCAMVQSALIFQGQRKPGFTPAVLS